MLNTPDDILSLGELSAVSGGEARQYCVSDPAFQDDVERLIGQCQSSPGWLVAMLSNYSFNITKVDCATFLFH